MTGKPNIVYILADDLGYGDISSFNPSCPFHTTAIDTLAQEGMAFTDAHAVSAVCTPSRYGILTGRYNWRSNLKSGVLGGYSSHLIEPGRKTVASLLHENGYHTACVGKWHLGMDWQLTADGSDYSAENDWPLTNIQYPNAIDYRAPIQNAPTSYGFDYFFGISASLDMPPYVYIENDHVQSLPTHLTKGEGKGFWREGATADNFVHRDVLPTLIQKVKDKITDYHDDPFFIYFPLPAPHAPILPTDNFVGKSGIGSYGDFVLMCDDAVGQIAAHLKQEGLYENTILLFTADNGCSPIVDFDELAARGHHPSYHFRGHKADIYEGGHRIPLVIKWDGMIAPHSTTDEPVCLCDFSATIADYLGLPLPDNAFEDSVSNLPLWLGTDYQKPLREALVHQSIDGSLSLRQGSYKLEMCCGSGGWSAPKPGTDQERGLYPVQLYDLQNDIGETTNIAPQHPDIVKSMRSLLLSYIRNGRSTQGAPQQNNGAALWDTIRWTQDEMSEE